VQLGQSDLARPTDPLGSDGSMGGPFTAG